ncbi:hypothetical protein [Acidovorax sp.]|uniref:phage tail assembly chaperone n=1 Tax=Acidovorax sp. TaxID=1872122 RepID=UPI00391F5840
MQLRHAVAVHHDHGSGSRWKSVQTPARLEKRDPLELIAEMFPEIPQVTARVPDEYMYVMGLFNDLHQRRDEGMNGARLITYQQIEAYERFNDFRLNRWERKTIVKLDEAWAEQMAIERKASNK